MLVCHCYAVTDGHIRDLVEAGAADVFDVAALCGAGSGCGGCLPRITDLLAESETAGEPCGRAMIGAASPAWQAAREPGGERRMERSQPWA